MHEAERSNARPYKTDYNNLAKQQKHIFLPYHNTDPDKKKVNIKVKKLE